MRSAWLATALLVCLVPNSGADAAPVGWYTTDTETVRDTKTGLVWQRGWVDSMAWDAGTAACGSLTLGGLTTGWRAPTVKELLTLVDDQAVNPAVDLQAFPNTPALHFWTTTADAAGGSAHWAVEFRWGATSVRTDGESAYTRCVR